MTILTSSRPPPHAVELQHWSLADGGGLGSLRTSLRSALTALRPAYGHDLDETAERVALVATELATNALQHGVPPTTVRLLCCDDRFILDVADGSPQNAPVPMIVARTSHRGRGLAIAESMSLQVGWYATALTKHVWASFPVAAVPALACDEVP